MNDTPITAFVALGSNLDDPERQVKTAIRELSELPQTRLLGASSLYRSAAVGYRDQPDFVNAVAAIATRLDPRDLLDNLLAIERRHQRVRSFRNAPRTLDLDLVLYGDRVIDEPGLAVPHPRMHERAFVIVPLAEIAPQAVVPGRGTVRDLLQAIDAASLTRIQEVRV
jgi:2-amino-4-hydroxy-6-hydroxymethyldihydropteridine diphosphokinase